MKLEMGESLFLSWLRHVKSCQIVQLNWKPSVATWNRDPEGELSMEALMLEASQFFQKKYDSSLFGNNSFEQLIRQAEVDVLGLSLEAAASHSPNEFSVYAIDVAFHEGGLNYGGTEKTAARIVKKYIRTAMCIQMYLGYSSGEIIFASPKVNNSFLKTLELYIADCQDILDRHGLNFRLRFLANHDFKQIVLDPIIEAIPSIADTSELFVRSIQMYNLFQGKSFGSDGASEDRTLKIPASKDSATNVEAIPAEFSTAGLNEMKIGILVRTELRKLLERNAVSVDEIQKMQTVEYSKETFGIQYPLLRPVQSDEKKPPRYWAEPVTTHGREYYVCSEWYETQSNNDRPLFMAWLKQHVQLD